MAYSSDSWYGDNCYFGLHYDIHAEKDDANIETHCTPDQLIPMLKLVKPDFIQTDCKGHPGMTSWFSQVPDATVSPGVKQDVLTQWSEAAKQHGIPLHCHYSGIWDKAASEKHPEWTIRPAPGSSQKSDKMCTRSPYLEKLLIPQLLELIDKYEVDGFLIDDDLQAVEPCYCEKCISEFTLRTGIEVPPISKDDPNWHEWIRFHLDSYKKYLTRYIDAVHQHKPGVKICAKWVQTLCSPGNHDVQTDWISGDNACNWGMDGCRCEARYINNRGKPWDIMLQSFVKPHGMSDKWSPWCMKPQEMLEQEAAMILATGGNVQIYETIVLHSGLLVPWRMERLGKVRDFIHARREICQNTQSVPQVAILHSETHYYSKNDSGHLLWGFNINPVYGAAWCISDCHRGVDILDEYMLKSRADEFPVIVVPDQIRMSDEMVSILKSYTEKGGILILTHPEIANRFGYEFTGIKSMETETDVVHYLPVHDSEAVPMYSSVWGKVVPDDDADVLFPVLKTPLTDDEIPNFPAAIVSERGKGKVVLLPMEIFIDYVNNRYPGTAAFMNDVLDEVWTDPQIKVSAGAAFDFIVRKSEKNGILLHFINRSSGLPLNPNAVMIDEIPPTGPVKVSIKLPQKPKTVKNVFPILSEEGNAVTSCSWIWEEIPAEKEGKQIQAGILHVMIPLIKIHDVIQIL